MQIQLASNEVLPLALPAGPFAENRFAGVLRRVGIGTRLTLVFSLLLALLCGALLGSSLHGEHTRAQLAAGMATAQNKRLYTTELEVKIGVQQLAIRALGLAFDGVPTLKRSEQAGHSLDQFMRAAHAAEALAFGPAETALIKQIEALSLELQAPFKSAVEQSMVQNAFGAAELIAKEIEPRQQKQRADQAAGEAGRCGCPARRSPVLAGEHRRDTRDPRAHGVGSRDLRRSRFRHHAQRDRSAA